MTYSQALNLIALTIGFISSLCFAWGSTFTTTEKIINQTGTAWYGNSADAKSRIEQSAQYLVGSILLITYFSLSIIATQASTEIIKCNYLANLEWFYLLAISFFIISVVSYFAIYLITKKRKLKLAEHFKNIS